MEEIQKSFEDWFINMHGDVDESLVKNKTDDGKRYIDSTTDSAWFCFKAGYCHCATKDM